MAISGKSACVLFGEETTYGTVAAALTTVFDRVKNVDWRFTNAEIADYGIGDREVGGLDAGQFEGVLTLTGALQIGYPILYAVGGASVAGSAPYVHTIAPNTVDELTSLSIRLAERLSTVSLKTFLGCRLNTLTLRASLDAPVEYTAEFYFKDMTEATNSYPSYTPLTDDTMIFQYGTLEIPVSSGHTFESWELTIANNILRDHGSGARKGNDLAGERKYTLNADVKLADVVGLDDALGDDGAVGATVSKQTMYLYLTNAGAGALMRKIEFKSEGFLYTELGESFDLGSTIIQSIAGTVNKFDGDANNYIKLSNNTASM